MTIVFRVLLTAVLVCALVTLRVIAAYAAWSISPKDRFAGMLRAPAVALAMHIKFTETGA
jgi:hypothetical protein